MKNLEELRTELVRRRIPETDYALGARSGDATREPLSIFPEGQKWRVLGMDHGQITVDERFESFEAAADLVLFFLDPAKYDVDGRYQDRGV